MRFSLYAITVMALLSLTTSHAFAEPVPSAVPSHEESKEAFVQGLSNNILNTLHDKKKSFTTKKALLQKTFVEIVDIPWISRFVLGKNWRVATEKEKEQYYPLYKKYLISNYLSNFKEETPDKLKDIKILSLSDTDEDRFTVRTEMLLNDGNGVHVDYLIKYDNAQYKVINITIEGVSLLATHRAEFSGLAADGGMANVIAKLKDVTQKTSSNVAQLEQ
jgi:phospholipid transport system substrate-binding protein